MPFDAEASHDGVPVTARHALSLYHAMNSDVWSPYLYEARDGGEDEEVTGDRATESQLSLVFPGLAEVMAGGPANDEKKSFYRLAFCLMFWRTSAFLSSKFHTSLASLV